MKTLFDVLEGREMAFNEKVRWEAWIVIDYQWKTRSAQEGLGFIKQLHIISEQGIVVAFQPLWFDIKSLFVNFLKNISKALSQSSEAK